MGCQKYAFEATLGRGVASGRHTVTPGSAAAYSATEPSPYSPASLPPADQIDAGYVRRQIVVLRQQRQSVGADLLAAVWDALEESEQTNDALRARLAPGSAAGRSIATFLAWPGAGTRRSAAALAHTRAR